MTNITDRLHNTRKSYVLCGHHKCGTRWLTHVLQSSNNLVVIDRRSIDEFVRDNKFQIRDMIKSSSHPVVINYIYSICDTNALERLKEIDPDMGAIIVYREPVDVILSMHNYQRWQYLNKRLVGHARDLRVERPVSDVGFVNSVKTGLLHEQFNRLFRYDRNAINLRNYFDTFLELKYENIINNEDMFVNRIFDFIGQESDFTLTDRPINPSISVKNAFVDRIIAKSFVMLTGLDSGKLYGVFRHGYLRSSLFRWLLTLNYKPPHFLKESQKAELKQHFAQMVEAFRQTTDLDLTDWGYDGFIAPR